MARQGNRPLPLPCRPTPERQARGQGRLRRRRRGRPRRRLLRGTYVLIKRGHLANVIRLEQERWRERTPSSAGVGSLDAPTVSPWSPSRRNLIGSRPARSPPVGLRGNLARTASGETQVWDQL